MTYYDKNIAMNAFTSLMKQVFSAEEVETLKHNLTQEGFFSAPASTKYHGRGGRSAGYTGRRNPEQ